MSTCATCSAELRPQWKFCIHCGTPVPEQSEPPAAVVEQPAQPIPSAIRPAAVEPSAPVARPVTVDRVNRLAIVSLAVGVFGGVFGILFGHLALHQLKTSGERGIVLARLATMCGYIWVLIYLFTAALIWLYA